jgi:ATP-dependent Clp protease ATP-binding subunit ClpB
VVLLDEIEKAHRDVFNVLLQILDDGRLTDGQGRTVDFRNAVLIMTSNIGSAVIQEAMRSGEGLSSHVRDQVTDALRAEFRPEFLNRVDEIVIFESLGKEHITSIVDIQLARVRKLLAERQLSLEVTPAAKAQLAEAGYDPVYGARPLKRAVQRLVLDPLSMKVLGGEFVPGDTIQVDAGKDGALTFGKVLKKGEPPAAFPHPPAQA